MWNYKTADTSFIKEVIKQVNWEFLFQNKNIHDKFLS